jgi:ribosomal subunit interface protein
VDIIFKGRRTDVPERFRKYAEAKLSKLGRLDRKAIRVDVEVSAERNPRQADRRQRVELTISSRGPVVRAEAAAEDRYAALDHACARLEERLRRASSRRKARHNGPATGRIPGPRAAADDGGGASPLAVTPAAGPEQPGGPGTGGEPGSASGAGEAAGYPGEPGDVVAIPMEGEGPLVVREKFHAATPMSIEAALFQMELAGHDFFLFRDAGCGRPSVVYRRHGYQYGVIRLVEEEARGMERAPGRRRDSSGTARGLRGVPASERV